MHRSQRVYSKMNNLGNSTNVSRSNSSRSVSSVTSVTSSASSTKSDGFKKAESAKKSTYKQEVKKMVKTTSSMCKTITKI